MNKPDNWRWSPADPQEAQRHHHHLQHGWQVAVALESHGIVVVVPQHSQTCWKKLRIKSEVIIIAYHFNSFRHLCSSTSLGHIVKSSSSVVMCERRFSILFLTATASCSVLVKGEF